MSKETANWLNTQTLIGYTDKRGKAWHYREAEQGDEPNHYPGPIPVEDVRRRLFDWTPEEAPLTVPYSGGVIIDDTRKAIIRPDTGTVLGVFRPGYRVHGYDEWLVRNVETILDADLAVGSAGLLRGGAVAWVQVELEDTVSVAGLEFRPFLTAATSLDGSLSTTYQTGAQVVVCDNTLSAAMNERGTNRLRIRHSSNSLDRLSDVRAALDVVHTVADDFGQQVDRLSHTEVTNDQWFDFLDRYAPLPAEGEAAPATRTRATNRRNELSDMWFSDERVTPWTGTGYGVLAAVNTWLHHGQPIRGGRHRAERNMTRMVTGEWQDHDEDVLQHLAATVG